MKFLGLAEWIGADGKARPAERQATTPNDTRPVSATLPRVTANPKPEREQAAAAPL